MVMDIKALTLLSGGMDSTVCATLARREYGRSNVEALTIYYGQKHRTELNAAKRVADFLGIKHRVKEVPSIFEGSKSSLIDEDRDHPEKTYRELNEGNELSAAYVPFRNGLFLSVAAVIAQEEEFDVIVYGPHIELGGETAYPDCGTEFNDAMAKAIFAGTDENVVLHTPLQHKTKEEVIMTGLRNGAPLHLTWTCYYSGEQHCGKCPACKSRIHALENIDLSQVFMPSEVTNYDNNSDRSGQNR